jgi:hypothetical protein
MSTIRVNTIQNTSGVEVYTAKAWVNFNGTGTVAIRASGNVSSITDNGTGNYTVNFTTAMSDANYSVTGCGSLTGIPRFFGPSTQTVNSVIVRTDQQSGSAIDFDVVNVAIFR